MHQEETQNAEGVGLNLPPPVVDPDDPLLIAQTLTYVTDDGSVLLSFTSSPFSFAFKLRFFLFEAIFVAILVAAVPVGAHGTVVSISIGNLFAVAWFWYNSVRCVDITSDGGLRFWIGNVEIDVPYDKIVGLHRLEGTCGICSPALVPHRGLLDESHGRGGDIDERPVDAVLGVAAERGAAGKEHRAVAMPKAQNSLQSGGGGLNFIKEVENEMHHNNENGGGSGGNRGKGGKVQPPSFDPAAKGTDFFDV